MNNCNKSSHVTKTNQSLLKSEINQKLILGINHLYMKKQLQTHLLFKAQSYLTYTISRCLLDFLSAVQRSRFPCRSLRRVWIKIELALKKKMKMQGPQKQMTWARNRVRMMLNLKKHWMRIRLCAYKEHLGKSLRKMIH